MTLFRQHGHHLVITDLTVAGSEHGCDGPANCQPHYFPTRPQLRADGRNVSRLGLPSFHPFLVFLRAIFL